MYMDYAQFGIDGENDQELRMEFTNRERKDPQIKLLTKMISTEQKNGNNPVILQFMKDSLRELLTAKSKATNACRDKNKLFRLFMDVAVNADIVKTVEQIGTTTIEVETENGFFTLKMSSNCNGSKAEHIRENAEEKAKEKAQQIIDGVSWGLPKKMK